MANRPTDYRRLPDGPELYGVKLTSRGPFHHVAHRDTRVTDCGVDFIDYGSQVMGGKITCRHCLNLMASQGGR